MVLGPRADAYRRSAGVRSRPGGLKRQIARWSPNMTRIVPTRAGNRMLRYKTGGREYALGYAKHPRCFGRRQRQTRQALMASMEFAVALGMGSKPGNW